MMHARLRPGKVDIGRKKYGGPIQGHPLNTLVPYDRDVWDISGGL